MVSCSKISDLFSISMHQGLDKDREKRSSELMVWKYFAEQKIQKQ